MSVLVLAVAVVIVSLAGCSGQAASRSAETPSAAVASTRPPDDPSDPHGVTREILADMEVKATGAVEFAWAGQEVLSIVRADTGRPHETLLGVQMPWTVPAVDPLQRFRFAVDLLGVYRDEPGTFAIDPRSAGNSGPQSFVFLMYLRVSERVRDDYQVHDEKDVLEQVRFDLVDQPCTVRVGVRAADGELRCAGLADESGRHVQFRATWRAVEGEDPITTPATPGEER